MIMELLIQKQEKHFAIGQFVHEFVEKMNVKMLKYDLAF